MTTKNKMLIESILNKHRKLDNIKYYSDYTKRLNSMSEGQLMTENDRLGKELDQYK